MDFMTGLHIEGPEQGIHHSDKIMLIGSCFTEHIADRLQKYKFSVLSNPHGILFNPLSVAYSIDSYVNNKHYDPNDLFEGNELWNSWDHHTRFSHIDKQEAIQGINASQQAAHRFIKETNWLIITLGSAFQYFLIQGNRPVANNHRAPAQVFEKRLLGIDQIKEALGESILALRKVNPNVKIIFTISPVRHLRDGVVANNRSKARLLEAVHSICDELTTTYYFPAYELVIDVLRDYRFYDIDMAHPNYQATQYVWEEFCKSYIDEPSRKIIEKVHEIVTAANHKPRFPETEAHQKFKTDQIKKIRQLLSENPHLDFTTELAKFI
jgi:hypothetical protein